MQYPETSLKKSASPVYLVDGARTPFLKARGKPGPFSPVDLAVQCGRDLLLRQPIPETDYDQVILGCVNVPSDEMNPARIAALRLGLDEKTPAYTVQINCGSGMQSIDNAFRAIRSGESDLVLAGGAEALSRAPLLLKQEAAEWLADLQQTDRPQDYVKKLAEFSPGLFKPVLGLQQGLTDPIVELGMGQTAEIVAHLFNVSRKAADEYAVNSHHRLAKAQEEGWLDAEISAAFDREGKLYQQDDGVRPDTTAESLAELSPVFEKPYGKVTAGNSSQVTDGACWTLLASEQALKKYGLEPLAVLVDSEWSALDPAIMGLGPVISSTRLLQRQHMNIHDIDLWEINEAFAAQVLSCLEAWQDPEFCKEALGLEEPPGAPDQDRLNVDGGAISLGHPVGTSGNRIVLHLAHAMERLDKQQGVATECIGGGQSGAMLLQRA